MEEYRRIYRCAVMGQHPMRFSWGFDEEDDRCQKLKMEQATKWAPYLRERYFTMLEKCTHISVVCPVGTPDAQLQAYKKILGLAYVVIYVHDADMSATDSGENRAFAFAVESHTPTLVLHPKELTAEWVGEQFYPRRS